MYRSIGDGLSIRERSIIGIFDLDNTSYSKHTRNFLSNAEENGQVIPVSQDLPKSFLLSREYGMDHVYLLQFSSGTMEKRMMKEDTLCPT